MTKKTYALASCFFMGLAFTVIGEYAAGASWFAAHMVILSMEAEQ